LSFRDCSELTYLPDWLKEVGTLDLHNCRSLTRLPEHLIVKGQITVSNTMLKELPEGCRRASIYWDHVLIDERIAFRPETITAQEVLNEPNVEVRRVMVERMGYERFIAEARPEVVDEDTDAGGVRQLLRIEMVGDEPLVCLRVHDPSTGRQYLLRVPPGMESCHQAAAWIAGFDNPDDYRLVVET
jgi:hypothetical protein